MEIFSIFKQKIFICRLPKNLKKSAFLFIHPPVTLSSEHIPQAGETVE